MRAIRWQALQNPFLEGNRDVAFRDPTAIYHDGRLKIFFSYVRREENNRFYWYVAGSETEDLITWTEPRIITEKGFDLNFSSPGNIVYYRDRWIMCLQTMPTPHKFREDPEHVFPSPDDPFHVTGDHNCRIWAIESVDLENWSEPRLLKVKGPNVAQEDMGRMIDAYLCQDKDEKDKWWCFYKQNGMSMSYSYDLENWTYVGHVKMGENVCVLVDGNEYVVFHSPDNGIGVKRSPDLISWRDEGVLTLGQSEWAWAAKRLTAGFVIDLRSVPEFGKYLMLFHGSSNLWDKNRNAHGHCSLGLAWSSDLVTWEWPK